MLVQFVSIFFVCLAFASWPRGSTSNAQNRVIITVEVVSLRRGHVARGENLIPGTKYE